MRRLPRHPAIDLDHDPVYIAHFGPNLEAELPGVLRSLEDMWENDPKPYVLILDALAAPPPSAKMRALISDHDKRMLPHKRVYCRGMGFVIGSAMMRGAINAIMWMVPPEYPTKSFGHVEEAVTWAKEQLRSTLAANN